MTIRIHCVYLGCGASGTESTRDGDETMTDLCEVRFTNEYLMAIQDGTDVRVHAHPHYGTKAAATVVFRAEYAKTGDTPGRESARKMADYVRAVFPGVPFSVSENESAVRATIADLDLDKLPWFMGDDYDRAIRCMPHAIVSEFGLNHRAKSGKYAVPANYCPL